jgi:hypothetical protein
MCLAPILFAAAVAACTPGPREVSSVSIEQVKADLETLAHARVYFGHQSVGRNILQGVRTLADEAGVALRIEEVGNGTPAVGPGLFHTNIGENGAPEGKLEAFLANVAAPALVLSPDPAPALYDIALLKFCYVDLDDDSQQRSPQALFDRYRSSVARLGERQRGLTLIHATMPLTADPPGWKTTVKRWLGRPTWTDAANRKRNEYNRMLRSQFAPDQTFDIARIEATHADGRISSFEAGGTTVETMAAEHTYDGGHLTAAAERHVAAAFLHTLAQSVRRREAAPAQPQ